jgi:spermidine/putrescine transport system substrate-binding protein
VDEEDDVHSWDILWNEKYANNILMFQNSRDTMGIALKRLGYSFNTTDESQIRHAAQTLVEQKPIVQAYVMDEIFDKMIGGEAALAPYYAGDAIVMMQDNPDLAFAVPNEGTNLFVDSMCIPADSKNKEAAEMYINFMCETLVALKNAEYVGYATPHSEAFTYLDEETQTSVTYPDDEVLDKAEAYIALPAATTSLLDSLWTDILSTGKASPWVTPLFMLGCIGATVVINVMKQYKKKKNGF